MRRDSARAGEEVVLVKYDLGGRDTGGTVPAWEVRVLWRVVKSE